MKILHLILFSLLTLSFLSSCSESSKDEPINSVFAFSTQDKNISITNNGINAVVNVGALSSKVEIKLIGTFIHTEIESTSKWVKATVTDKMLTLSIDANYSETERSANIAIKANDQSEIVLANMAINQAAPTTEELDIWQIDDILSIVQSEGGSYTIPSNGELERNKWYQLYSDNSAFFRIINREDNTEIINQGDEVSINFMICYIEDMYYNQNWWLLNFYHNKDANQLYTVTQTPSQAAINDFGKGILDVLNKASLHYNDDIDILQSSYVGLPKFADKHWPYIYVVQYNNPKGSQSSSPSKISPRFN